MKVDGRKLSSKEIQDIRIEVVKRVQSGETPTEVARDKGLYTCRVFEWLALYRSGGWDSLKVKKGSGGGRRKKLSGHQIQWIYDAVTMKSPYQLKFDFALWTRKMIRDLIRRRFRITLSLSSIGRLLAQLGLSWQKPLKKAYEQNPASVEKWLKQTFPYIKKRAKRLGATIFFSDESGLRSDFQSGKTWSIKGQTPVVKKTGKRFSLNMISATSNRGDIRFKIIDGRFNAGEFISFCKQLITDVKKPVFLIVDGHPAHKAKKVKEFIKSMRGKLSLYFLPPYSPDLNPDEYVWNDVKNNGVHRKSIETKDDLKSAALSRLRHLQKSPEKVKSFFRAKNTKYAA
jgi:transposase